MNSAELLELIGNGETTRVQFKLTPYCPKNINKHSQRNVSTMSEQQNIEYKQSWHYDSGGKGDIAMCNA